MMLGTSNHSVKTFLNLIQIIQQLFLKVGESVFRQLLFQMMLEFL